MRTICLLLFTVFATRLQAQTPPPNEDFVNTILNKSIGNTVSDYYLIAGSDTCRFEKFDYDEWVKYNLKENVPITILNELAYKVHMTHEPYFWQQNKLKKATCITAGKADSLLASAGPKQVINVFSLSRPQFTDDGKYAVIDINWKYGPIRGSGYTFIYRHAPTGWLEIGFKRNWGGDL